MIKFQISDPDKSRPSSRVRRIGAPPKIVPAANVRKREIDAPQIISEPPGPLCLGGKSVPSVLSFSNSALSVSCLPAGSFCPYSRVP